MLNGKTALVTGASRGIGKAIALELARQGANVAVIYAGNTAAAEETVADLTALGVIAGAYQCDISDFDAAKAVCKAVTADFGPVHILVNNAGIVKDGLIATMKEGDFDRVMDTNLKGAFHMVKHLYSNFLKLKGGRIINITSVVGIMGNAGQANYAASKAGLIGFTKSVARELAGRNVTCNAVAPGFIETEMTAALTDDQRAAYDGMIPLKRLGAAADVAAAVAFLASDAAGYITGEVLRVDGGLCM